MECQSNARCKKFRRQLFDKKIALVNKHDGREVSDHACTPLLALCLAGSRTYELLKGGKRPISDKLGNLLQHLLYS